MLRSAVTLFLVLFTFQGDALAQRTTGDAAVVAAFEGYRGALVARDGASAMRFLLPSAAAYYEECRVAAIEMPEAELRGRSVIFRYTVLDIRHRHTLAQARATSGRAILRQAVSDGRVGSAVSSVRTGAVEIRGDRALLELRPATGAGVMRARLVRVRGHWKLDLIALITSGERAVDAQLAALGGGDTNAGILRAFQALTGRPADAKIWEPLAHRVR